MVESANDPLPYRHGVRAGRARFGGRSAAADPLPISHSANGTDMNTITGRNGHSIKPSSRETAVEFVIDAIESTGAATRDDFDIDRIVSTIHALADDWDFNTLQPATFWRVASSCIKA
ncbi:hypothetical protein [Nocardia paucivorans]|uniref:hypothetical protein n=1 Tax=Nocardia paucivorans TaxID=114259 RepID=UPI001FE1C9AC|nr:hypothetical protein [Nocardia paucivorans]